MDDQQERQKFEDRPSTEGRRIQENPCVPVLPEHAVDRKHDEEIIVSHESVLSGPTAGSTSSNRKFVFRPKQVPVSPEKAVAMKHELVEVAAGDLAGDKRIHCCKECDKNFSSGKALGGHMIQASKDYSLKKLKSRMTGTKLLIRSSGSCSDSGLDDNGWTFCGKCFPSQKSLYGHMRCHPDREWRGMEPPPAGPKVDTGSSSEIESGTKSTDLGRENVMDSGPEGEAGAVDFAGVLKWAGKDRRGRPSRPIRTVAGESQGYRSSDDEAVWAAMVLVRFLKWNVVEETVDDTAHGMLENPSSKRPVIGR